MKKKIVGVIMKPDKHFNLTCAMLMIIGVMMIMIGMAPTFVPELKDVDLTYYSYISCLPLFGLPLLYFILNKVECLIRGFD